MRSRLHMVLCSFSLLALPTGVATAQESTSAMKSSQDEMSMAPEAATSAAAFPSPQTVEPLQPGAEIPKIDSLQNGQGGSVDLGKMLEGKTSVLIFYRGGWCPYCTAHLAEMARIHPMLLEKGVQIIAISPDPVEALAKFESVKPAPYTLLSDTKREAIKSFGIAFSVDGETETRYKGYGIDLRAGDPMNEAILPVPAVFVVGPDGRVAYTHHDPDYKKRLSGADVLRAVGIDPEKMGEAPAAKQDS